MKILIGTPYFYPVMGGLENYSYKLARGLHKTMGWEVVVITSNHKSKKDIKEIIEGMTIYRLAPLFHVSNTPVNPFWVYKTWKIIKNEKPNIVNAHTPVPFMADVLAITSLGMPFILTYHATSLFKAKGSLFNTVVWTYKKIENLLLLRSDKIITVSKFVAQILPKKYRKKTIVINNFVDDESLQKKAAEKKDQIIFIGNLDKTHAWKGLDMLLKAVKLLVDAYGKNVTLNVIGEGNNKHSYMKTVSELNMQKHVKFLGRKIGEEKDKYIRKAKVAVIYPTTSNDALPTFLLESWANRTSTIVSNIYPISKIVKSNITGKVVEPNNSSKLANGILDLLESKNTRKRLEENGYKHVKQLYSYSGELKKFETILRKVTN